MSKKPIIIVSGEPYSVFFEIFFKALKSKDIKSINSPIIIIGSEQLLIKQMKKLNFSFKIKLIDKNLSNIKSLNNNNINLINVSFKFNKIFDKISKKSNNYMTGKIDGGQTTHISSKNINIGDYVKVLITEASPFALKSELI